MKFKTFCAANSGFGFISFFDTLLDEKKYNVYYIKGGPGCGKSTFMKKIADRAKDAELIYCSGDPRSLDGVVLPNQRSVIIDATAPHSHEPKYPAVGGNIIDLGESWSPEKMNKEKILELCDEKSEIYRSCYSLLKSAQQIHTGVFANLLKHINYNKITKISEKILLQNALWENKFKPANIKKRFLSGISPDGLITLSETFNSLGKNIILLEDRWMIADILLKCIDKNLNERGIDHLNSYHPLLGKESIHHIIIPEANLSIVSKDSLFDTTISEENIVRKINIQHVIEKPYLDLHKNKLSFIKRLQKEILYLAVEKIAAARSVHMKIEQEYATGTAFEATEHLKKNLMDKLFS